MPVDPAAPVVTAACFLFCRRAMGEAFTRHSLHPLTWRVRSWQSSGGTGRENAIPWAHNGRPFDVQMDRQDATRSRAKDRGMSRGSPCYGGLRGLRHPCSEANQQLLDLGGRLSRAEQEA